MGERDPVNYIIPACWAGPVARAALKNMGCEDLDRFTDEQCVEIIEELIELDDADTES